MTGHSKTTANGTYEVVEKLRRAGGAVDLVVAYRKKKRGATTTYTAFRWEPDGMWKAFNNSWSSADAAIEHVSHTDRYALVAADWMKEFLAGAIGPASECPSLTADAVAEHVDRPTWQPWTDPDFRREQADYTDTPSDEGDNEQ